MGLRRRSRSGSSASIVAARVFTVAQFGVFMTALAVVGFFQTLLDLTVEESLTKYGFRYVSTGDWGRLRRLFRQAFLIKLVGGALATLILLALAPLADSIFDEQGVGAALVAASLLPLVQASENIGATALLLHSRYDLRGVYQAGSGALRLIAIAIGVQYGVTEALAAIVRRPGDLDGVASGGRARRHAALPGGARPAARRGRAGHPLVRAAVESRDGSRVPADDTRPGCCSASSPGRRRSATSASPRARRPGSPPPARRRGSSCSRSRRGTGSAASARACSQGIRKYTLGAGAIMLVAVPVFFFAMPWLVDVVFGEKYADAVEAARIVLLAAAIQFAIGWTKSLPVTVGRPQPPDRDARDRDPGRHPARDRPGRGVGSDRRRRGRSRVDPRLRRLVGRRALAPADADDHGSRAASPAELPRERPRRRPGSGPPTRAARRATRPRSRTSCADEAMRSRSSRRRTRPEPRDYRVHLVVARAAAGRAPRGRRPGDRVDGRRTRTWSTRRAWCGVPRSGPALARAPARREARLGRGVRAAAARRALRGDARRVPARRRRACALPSLEPQPRAAERPPRPLPERVPLRRGPRLGPRSRAAVRAAEPGARGAGASLARRASRRARAVTARRSRSRAGSGRRSRSTSRSRRSPSCRTSRSSSRATGPIVARSSGVRASSASTGVRASSAASRVTACFACSARRMPRCSPSWENLPHTVLEALAVGCPVIATCGRGRARGRAGRRERPARRTGATRRRSPPRFARFFADEDLRAWLAAAAAGSVDGYTEDAVFTRIEERARGGGAA